MHFNFCLKTNVYKNKVRKLTVLSSNSLKQKGGIRSSVELLLNTQIFLSEIKYNFVVRFGSTTSRSLLRCPAVVTLDCVVCYVVSKTLLGTACSEVNMARKIGVFRAN